MRPERLAAALACVLLLGVQGVCGGAPLPSKGTVEVAFSPADDPLALLLEVIAGARKTLHVQAYVFTSQPIAKALVAAHHRGVQVEVLADEKMNHRGNKAMHALLSAGVPLAFETRYAAAHNKVIIADAAGPGCAVVTGSFNFTWSASNRNAENLLVLRDHCALARVYLDNFKRHRAEARTIRRLPVAR